MGISRISHAVCDTKYHLVWTPKYRKGIMREDIPKSIKGYFEEISKANELEIDTMEIAEDHVHIFLSFPPRYSISQVVGILKARSASQIFREHPEVKRELEGGEFWESYHRSKLWANVLYRLTKGRGSARQLEAIFLSSFTSNITKTPKIALKRT